MKVAIIQSNYIPWKGYFDMIAAVDEFILYDDMQFTRRDWRNRNKIKTKDGLKWLTVPVLAKGKFHQKISETKINGCDWAKTHWMSLLHNYKKAPHFEKIEKWLCLLYKEAESISNLSELNHRFIVEICKYLGIETKISVSTDYDLIEGKTERLANLCLQVNASEYLSGPSAKGYIEEHVFHENSIKLTWFDYSDYPIYLQPHGEFEHGVSIIDMLFNCGSNSPHHMKYVQ